MATATATNERKKKNVEIDNDERTKKKWNVIMNTRRGALTRIRISMRRSEMTWHDVNECIGAIEDLCDYQSPSPHFL